MYESGQGRIGVHVLHVERTWTQPQSQRERLAVACCWGGGGRRRSSTGRAGAAAAALRMRLKQAFFENVPVEERGV